jgi:hypothetical protein
MYINTPLCRYWITLYKFVLVLIVSHVNHVIEDNKQFFSNSPRKLKFLLHDPIVLFTGVKQRQHEDWSSAFIDWFDFGKMFILTAFFSTSR